MKTKPLEADNIFASIPDAIDSELFDVLHQQGSLKIERIVSRGHASPATGWYDQEQDEWVIVCRGEAIITLENGGDVHLEAGSHLLIPAHTRHRVAWTAPDRETIWLAVHC